MTTKPSTKKQVPIILDERETFVSLQKDFADSSVSVAEKLKLLYSLQQTDIEIDKIKNLRGALPSEVALIEEELTSLKSKVARHQELIAGYEQSIQQNKADIEEIDAQTEKYRAELDSISNSREFDSINKEIENQGLLHDIAQKHIGEARVAIAEKKDAIDALQDRIAIREQDYEAKKEELDNIIASTAEEEEQLLSRRESLESKIDARTLSAYHHIKASVRNHLAVVPVYNEDSCGGCFNAVTAQKILDIASGTKLVICENCGRILVNPAAEIPTQQ